MSDTLELSIGMRAMFLIGKLWAIYYLGKHVEKWTKHTILLHDCDVLRKIKLDWLVASLECCRLDNKSIHYIEVQISCQWVLCYPFLFLFFLWYLERIRGEVQVTPDL